MEDSPAPRDLVALQTAGPVPLASLRSLWWRVPTVAAAYFVAARLGFLLDLEPGFASSIWPAAGIGSAALLIWGSRLWPGVLLGSFLFNWWLSDLLLAEMPGSTRTAGDIAVSLAIAGGVALQALFCASLARPVLRAGRVLTSVRSAVPFLLMSGPVSCLVSASVGAGARWVSGDLPLGEVWANWFTWWMGDSIGVLFFVPLTLLAFPEARPRRLGLAARLAIPLIVVGVLVAVAHRATQDSRREHTSREMAAIENELQFQLNSQITNLHLVERLLTLVPRIDSRQFAEFAAQTLTPGVQTLEWVPRVTDAERAAFEAAASAGGDPFRILEPTESGALIAAPARPEYFPTLYVEPRLTADAERGLDHSTDPIRRAAMSRARDTGQATVTAPVTLAGDRQTRAVIAVVPVYTTGGGRTAPTVAGRQDTLRGFAMSVMPIDSIAQNLAREAATLRLAASLVDVSNPAETVPIFSQGTPARAGASLRVSLPVVFGGRAWRLDLAPVRPDLLPGETRDGRLMLAGAVLLTFLTGLFVLTEAGLSIAVAVEVQHRTAELSGEVIVRRRLEAQARESEARFRTIFDNSTDLLQSVDALGGFVQVNPAWKRLLGYTDDDLKHLNLFDVVAPEDAAILEGLLLRLIRGEQVGTFDVTMLCKDGRRVVLEGNVSAHIQEGAPLVTRGIFRDVTTRKIAETQLAIVRERLGLARPRLEARAVGPRGRGRARLPERGLGRHCRHRAPGRGGADRVAHRARAPRRSPRDYRRGLRRAQGRAGGIPGRAPGADGQRALEVDPVARHGHRAQRQRARQAHDRHQRRHRRAEARRRGHGGGRAPPARGHRRPAGRRLPVPVVRRQPGPVQLPQRRRPGPARRRPRGHHPRAAPGLRRDRQGRSPRLPREPRRRDHQRRARVVARVPRAAEGRPRGVEPQRREPPRHRRRRGVERLLGGHLVA